MAFIKVQRLVRGAAGEVISGSAAIVETRYVKSGKYHARHSVREKLGKVLQLAENRKSGVFLSPTRGVVAYDSESDSFSDVERGDPRVSGRQVFPEAPVHTVFGDVHLFLSFLEKSGLAGVLRDAFPQKKTLERVLCHVLHGVLRDGSRISCENFVARSFASHLAPDVPPATLRSDSRYFAMLGDDRARLAYFKAFVARMRRAHPDFGRACYVDSTPLPNDIRDNPFNALCSHGVGASAVMTRLALVLDEATGLPVWFNLIPGNQLDMKTLETTMADVSESLGITVGSLVLDAGYVTYDLLDKAHVGTGRTFIGRMPARKGYPHRELYRKVKDKVQRGKYCFKRAGSLYFGDRHRVSVNGNDEFAYVYVDLFNANKKLCDFIGEHGDEFNAMKDCQKDWYKVKFGFFVLLSNEERTPEEMLSEYFGRVAIEGVFKTGKEYLQLLPIAKWTDLTIRGKILHDVIDTTALLMLRKELASSTVSTSDLFGATQSLMCFRSGTDAVTVEQPNRKVKAYYKLLGLDVPSHLSLNAFSDLILGMVKM